MEYQTSTLAMSVPKGAIAPPTPEQIASAINSNGVTISWLAGDGSDRSYYRVLDESNKSYVLMQLSGEDAASLNAGKYEWTIIQSLLAKTRIITPNLIKSCPEFNALIIEDYGNTMLESVLKKQDGNIEKQMPYFNQAFEIIDSMLKLSLIHI